MCSRLARCTYYEEFIDSYSEMLSNLPMSLQCRTFSATTIGCHFRPFVTLPSIFVPLLQFLHEISLSPFLLATRATQNHLTSSFHGNLDGLRQLLYKRIRYKNWDVVGCRHRLFGEECSIGIGHTMLLCGHLSWGSWVVLAEHKHQMQTGVRRRSCY